MDMAPQVIPIAPKASKPTSSLSIADTALGEFLMNEDGIALAFAKLHRGRLLYDHHACHWFVWTGSVWKMEETQLAFEWARKTCRAIAGKLEPDDKLKHVLARASVSSAVERFAKADRDFAVDAGVWDKNPWLLGTPDGTIDLRTGDLREADPSDRITKMAAVAPAAPGTQHPLWTMFLRQATNQDPELQAFLQRLAGYILTGDVTEETLAFLYGDGGAGKGTFINVIVSILADYGISVPIEVFTAGSRINLEYYRAQMAGARLVTASETEQGATWAESQIKEMTGNEAPLSGRHAYGKVFNFWPQFKIILIGNHAPKLKGRSKAMERRLRIVPFKHKPANPDETLKERLKAEYPAILRWMIEGCLEWQHDRLGSARAIDAASGAYFEQQDTLGHWMEERCLTGDTLSEKRATLYTDFVAWTKGNGETAMASSDFKEAIDRTPGLRSVKLNGNRIVRGIGLKVDMSEQSRRYAD